MRCLQGERRGLHLCTRAPRLTGWQQPPGRCGLSSHHLGMARPLKPPLKPMSPVHTTAARTPPGTPLPPQAPPKPRCTVPGPPPQAAQRHSTSAQPGGWPEGGRGSTDERGRCRVEDQGLEQQHHQQRVVPEQPDAVELRAQETEVQMPWEDLFMAGHRQRANAPQRTRLWAWALSGRWVLFR